MILIFKGIPASPRFARRSSSAYRSRDVVQGLIALRYFFLSREPVTLIAPFRGWGCKSKVTTTRACTSFESRLPLGDVVQGSLALRYFFKSRTRDPHRPFQGLGV